MIGTWSSVSNRLAKASVRVQKLDEEAWGSLEEHGLTGMPLRFKLSIFRALMDRFEKGARWIWIHRFFRQIDVILDSLSAVPGLGILSAVTEFKESLENLMKWRGKLPTPES